MSRSDESPHPRYIALGNDKASELVNLGAMFDGEVSKDAHVCVWENVDEVIPQKAEQWKYE